MTKRQKALERAIEESLQIGRYISYNEASSFINTLERTCDKVKKFASTNPVNAVSLYELFLSGGYEKYEEIDDSGADLGMFMEGLFIDWITARRKAKSDAEETVNQILNWVKNDDYGVTTKLEKNAAKILGRKELTCYKAVVWERFQAGLKKKRKDSKVPHWEARHNAGILKAIYTKTRDVDGYTKLTQLSGLSPKDCKNFAEIFAAKRNWQTVLEWVDKGFELKKKKAFQHEYVSGLDELKKKALLKLGKNEDALQHAWTEFSHYPDDFTYEDLMKYVPKTEKGKWREKAVQQAAKLPLSKSNRLLLYLREYEILKKKVESVTGKALEDLGHYVLEMMGAIFVKKKFLPAAAKVYRALGMRIVSKGKSKYYDVAIDHFIQLKKLYIKLNKMRSWNALVKEITDKHSRKRSFMEDFEKLIQDKSVQGRTAVSKQLKDRWKAQIAEK